LIRRKDPFMEIVMIKFIIQEFFLKSPMNVSSGNSTKNAIGTKKSVGARNTTFSN